VAKIVRRQLRIRNAVWAGLVFAGALFGYANYERKRHRYTGLWIWQLPIIDRGWAKEDEPSLTQGKGKGRD
jgi:hypothetical protein